MKKVDVTQFIGLLANIGVIAGIVFLGIELGQNNRLLKAQSAYALVQNRVEINDAVFRDPEIADLLMRARTNPNELSAADRIRLNVRATNTFINYEDHFSQIRAGNLQDEEGLAAAMRRTFANPISIGIPEEIFFGVWERMREQFSTEFVSFVDETIIDSRQRP